MARVMLYRPFPADVFVEALPATVQSVAVLDRTKEPGSVGEPLFLDVVAAMNDAVADGRARGDAEGDRRPLWLVLEGVHSGDGGRRARAPEARASQATLHGRYQRRRVRYEPLLRPLARNRAARNRTGRVFRPGLGRDGRRQ